MKTTPKTFPRKYLSLYRFIKTEGFTPRQARAQAGFILSCRGRGAAHAWIQNLLRRSNARHWDKLDA